MTISGASAYHICRGFHVREKVSVERFDGTVVTGLGHKCFRQLRFEELLAFSIAIASDVVAQIRRFWPSNNSDNRSAILLVISTI